MGITNLVILGFGFTICIASGVISVIIKIDILLVGLPYSPELYLFGVYLGTMNNYHYLNMLYLFRLDFLLIFFFGFLLVLLVLMLTADVVYANNMV